MPACRGWAARKAIAWPATCSGKCGYYSLLFHSPPLTEDACLALFSVPFATAPAVAFLNEAFVASPVFPGARTRAPPFLIA